MTSGDLPCGGAVKGTTEHKQFCLVDDLQLELQSASTQLLGFGNVSLLALPDGRISVVASSRPTPEQRLLNSRSR